MSCREWRWPVMLAAANVAPGAGRRAGEARPAPRGRRRRHHDAHQARQDRGLRVRAREVQGSAGEERQACPEAAAGWHEVLQVLADGAEQRRLHHVCRPGRQGARNTTSRASSPRYSRPKCRTSSTSTRKPSRAGRLPRSTRSPRTAGRPTARGLRTSRRTRLGVAVRRGPHRRPDRPGARPRRRSSTTRSASRGSRFRHLLHQRRSAARRRQGRQGRRLRGRDAGAAGRIRRRHGSRSAARWPRAGASSRRWRPTPRAM